MKWCKVQTSVGKKLRRRKGVKTYLCWGVGGSTKRNDGASCGKGCLLRRKTNKRTAFVDNQLSFLCSTYVTLQVTNSVIIKRLLGPAYFIAAFPLAIFVFMNNFFLWCNIPTRAQNTSMSGVSRSHTNTCTAARTPLHE